jgi:hypothetical protein
LGSSFPPSFLPPILQSELAPTRRRSGEEGHHLERRRWEGGGVAARVEGMTAKAKRGRGGG